MEVLLNQSFNTLLKYPLAQLSDHEAKALPGLVSIRCTKSSLQFFRGSSKPARQLEINLLFLSMFFLSIFNEEPIGFNDLDQSCMAKSR